MIKENFVYLFCIIAISVLYLFYLKNTGMQSVVGHYGWLKTLIFLLYTLLLLFLNTKITYLRVIVYPFSFFYSIYFYFYGSNVYLFLWAFVFPIIFFVLVLLFSIGLYKDYNTCSKTNLPPDYNFYQDILADIK